MNMLEIVKAVKDQLAKVEVTPGKVTSTGKSQQLGNANISLNIDGNKCVLKVEVFRLLVTREEREDAIAEFGQTIRKSSSPAAKLQGAFTAKSKKGHSVTLEAAAKAGNKEAKRELARLAKLEAERESSDDDDDLNADELD